MKRSGDEATVADVKWPYFQSMIFLKDILPPRPTRSSLDESKCFDDDLEIPYESNDGENMNESCNNSENDVGDIMSCFKRPSSEFVMVAEEISQIKKSKTKKRLQKENGDP